ncbi:4099_t:CDS:2, partial [Ambispora gerdemannii]
LEWMLIGCPSEIGYFDSTTRDKEIKTGSTILRSCRINLDRFLSPSIVVSLNVEYPTTRKTPIFKASYQILQKFYPTIEIKVEPIKNEYIEFLNECEEIAITILWCVLFEGSQGVFNQQGYHQDELF